MPKFQEPNERERKPKKRSRGPSRGDMILKELKDKEDHPETPPLPGSKVYDRSIPSHWQPNSFINDRRNFRGDSKASKRLSKASGNRHKASGGKPLPAGITKTMIRVFKRHNPEMGRRAILNHLA